MVRTRREEERGVGEVCGEDANKQGEKKQGLTVRVRGKLWMICILPLSAPKTSWVCWK